MRVVSLFAGIGGFDLGFERAGLSCVQQVEIDDKARSVLASHWPAVGRSVTDVRDANSSTLTDADVFCGGFPCQDVSVAGKRAGLAGSRSGLWFEFHRVLSECRPRWVVIENVPGLLSSNGGADFGVILAGLVECGYGIAWRILDAQYFGVAQRRRRVFIVGHLGDGRAAQVLFERESLPGNPAAGREAGPGVASPVKASPPNRRNGGSWPTPGEFVFKRRGGFGWSQLKNMAPTLESQGGSHQGGPDNLPIVTEPLYYSHDYNQDRIYSPHGLAPAVTANDSNKSRNVLAFNHNASASDHMPVVEEHTPSLRAGTQSTAVAFTERTRAEGRTLEAQNELAYALTNPGSGGRTHSRQIVDPRLVVRRLTPTECERLQAFPDGWTAGQSDSARYRQLGNAVNVAVAEWLGQRLMMVEAEHHFV